MNKIWRYIVGAIVTAAVLFLVWYFSDIVLYILVSAVLAIVGRPLVRRLSVIRYKRFRLSRGVAAALTLLTMWVVFFTAATLLIPLVVSKIYEFATVDFSSVLKSVEEPVMQVQYWLDSLLLMPEEKLSLTDILAASLSRIIDYETINTALLSIINTGLSFIIAFLSISFITFFFLKEDGLFYSMVKAFFPDRYEENVTRALDKITVLLSRYFVGLLAESAVLMTVISIVMLLFGMDAREAFFIGLIMGVMNVIPYAGPFLGGIASVFVGIVTPIDGYSAGTTMVIIICTLLCIKGLDDFVLQPTLYSERVKAHPLEVFLVILIAGSVAGIPGMLFAIPLYTVLRVFAKEFFSQVSLVRKLTENV